MIYLQIVAAALFLTLWFWMHGHYQKITTDRDWWFESRTMQIEENMSTIRVMIENFDEADNGNA